MNLDDSTDELAMSIRSYNCLEAEGVKTIRDLISLLKACMFDGYKVRNMGITTRMDLCTSLIEYLIPDIRSLLASSSGMTEYESQAVLILGFASLNKWRGKSVARYTEKTMKIHKEISEREGKSFNPEDLPSIPFV